MSSRRLLLAVACLLPTVAFAQMATAPFEGRLKQIHETKRSRSPIAPRSAVLVRGRREEPAGYPVDLCRGIVAVIERQIGVSPLQFSVP